MYPWQVHVAMTIYMHIISYKFTCKNLANQKNLPSSYWLVFSSHMWLCSLLSMVQSAFQCSHALVVQQIF